MRRLLWHIFRPKSPRSAINLAADGDVYAAAKHKLEVLLPRHPRPERIKKVVQTMIHDAEVTHSARDWLAALVVQAPRAVQAQAQMDHSPHGYHNKQARLYELIDFNDAFVSTVLAMTDEQRAGFSVKAKELCDWICWRANIAGFTDEQWLAIDRGLSREISLYLAAESHGFKVHMTSRTQDAMGIDMQIMDPDSGRYINVDCKSPSAFRYRLEELVREGRMTPRGQIEADTNGYAVETNGHGSEKANVILMVILPDYYGEIRDFRFERADQVRVRLNRLIRDHGLTDGKFGSVN